MSDERSRAQMRPGVRPAGVHDGVRAVGGASVRRRSPSAVLLDRVEEPALRVIEAKPRPLRKARK